MSYLIIKKGTLKLPVPIDLECLQDRLHVKRCIQDDDLLTFCEQGVVIGDGFEYQNEGLHIKICATKEEAGAS